MTSENFARALKLALKHEGGYVDHPADPGGATNLGVTIGTLSKWTGRPATKADVKALTPATVAPIYRKGYWDAVRADELPAGVDYCTFDAAVNSGPARAAKWLQRAVGVSVDGAVGPLTIKAARELPAPVIINRMCDDRLDFLEDLPTWKTFGKGWTSRVEGVRREALAMAEAVAPVPPPPDIEPIPALPQQPAATAAALVGAVVAALVALAAYLGIDANALKAMIP